MLSDKQEVFAELRSLIYLINTVFRIYYIILLARVLLSWIRPNIVDPNWRQVLKIIYDVTEPVLGPIRRLLPMRSIGIDFSPVIAFLILNFLQSFIIKLLINLNMDLGF